MTSAIRISLLCLALVLLIGAALWYYLFGPNKVAAADLVPSDTVVFATIPNAAAITADYETSHLKQIVDSPNAKPLLDTISNQIGGKNLELLQAFLPCLSGQSFIALTHFDPNNPVQAGLIAGLKPKPGLGDFNGFIDKLKAAYPDALAQGTTGSGQVEGLDYQWIKGPNAPDKICVAQYRGWIITAWGEASLQDWWDRLGKKASTPSLSQNAAYQKSLLRVGKDSETILYIDSQSALGMLQKHLASTNPAQGTYLAKKWQALGAMMVGTRFEDGDIADHFSMLIPAQAQRDAGMTAGPCAFDTLKFTSPDTEFYWARSLDFGQAWKDLQEQSSQAPGTNPVVDAGISSLQNWAQNEKLDLQHNVIDPLGKEISFQLEWGSDATYPEAGLFVKLDKPDDFKPTIAAIVDTIRQRFETSAVVNEISANGHNFATLKFVQPLPISPTITEDGPYFGIFLTENQAARSFQRDESVGLLNDAGFKRQIGDRKADASQLIFFNSPKFLDRTYQTAMPYLSLAAMFNPTLGSALKGRNLPPDLQWLAPIDSWSVAVSSDDEGVKGYSVSGIGNQGIFITGGLGAASVVLRSLGHPLSSFVPSPTPPPAPPPIIAPAPPLPAPAPVPDTATNAAPAPEAAPAPVAPSPTTNAPPTAPAPAQPQ